MLQSLNKLNYSAIIANHRHNNMDRSMDKKTSKAKTNDSADNQNDDDNVDKIRDILFGNQMREVEKRFNSLEKNLASDLDKLRNENALQIESLKTFIESEIEILGSKLAGEESARIENVDELDNQLKQQVKLIKKEIGDVGKSLDKQTSDTNKKMLKQSQDFSKELTDQISEARERMDGHRDELAGSKVDKLLLAELLNTLALQINPQNEGQ